MQPAPKLTQCMPLCSLKEVLIVVGILLGYLASYQFVDTVGGWRIMYGASAVPALLLLAGMVRALPSLSIHAHQCPSAVSPVACPLSSILTSEQPRAIY